VNKIGVGNRKGEGKPGKINQDMSISISNFSGVSGQFFFGLFDGHGLHGHYVADYARN
jgi:serine/threonine protein phosphatase PrpC